MNMNKTPFTKPITQPISIETTTFPQEVANFLFSCDQKLSSSSRRLSIASWIGDTARAVTLRSVATSGDVSSLIPGADDINGDRKLVINRSDYICMTCGTILLPQSKLNTNNEVSSLSELGASLPTSSLFDPSSTSTNCKISLHQMKRGRSRRRRASRCRAKELHNSSLLTKRAGSTNNAQVRGNVMAQKELLKVADLYRLGDGKTKQCIVVECKFCGSKRKRKGIEVCVKNARRKTEDAKASCSKNFNDKKKHPHTQIPVRQKMNTIGAQIQENSDFISLASFGQQATKKRAINDNALLLQAGKKKKKKQEPKSKKSSLMDFLSSLND